MGTHRIALLFWLSLVIPTVASGTVCDESLLLERASSPGGVYDSITVERVGLTEVYERTNRGVELLTSPGDGVYPLSAVNLTRLSGKKVLDVGTGNGGFVTDLRAAGIEAIGLDVYLHAEQKQHPYFVEGDAARMPFQDGSYDYVYSAWSVLSSYYSENLPDDFVTRVLREVARVLRSGGFAHFGGTRGERIDRLLKSVPELELVQKVDLSASWEIPGLRVYFEVRKR